MLKKCFWLTLLLIASVHTQVTDNPNVDDVETIPQGVTDQVHQVAAPVQVNEQKPGNEISPNDPGFGKNISKIFYNTNRLGYFFEQSNKIIVQYRKGIKCWL